MERKPLISVIIPVYNVEMYLDECLQSVINQTYRNLDIVLVDDGSQDRSAALCDEYAGKDSRIRVIHKENGGPMSACITGIGMAKGEYLAFMDSDDWIELTMMEELVKYTDGTGGEIISSNYLIEKENQTIAVKQSLQSGIYDRKAMEEQLFPCLLGKEVRRIHGSRCMKLISKELLEKNLEMEELKVFMGEDLYLIFLALLDAKRLVVVEDGYFYHYRFVESSLVHRYKANMRNEVGELYHKLQQAIETKVADEKQRRMFRQELKQEYIFLFFFVIKNELRSSDRDYVSRIQRYIKEEKKNKNLDEITVEVQGKANRFLYLIWKNPCFLSILTVRFMIKIFDRI